MEEGKYLMLNNITSHRKNWCRFWNWHLQQDCAPKAHARYLCQWNKECFQLSHSAFLLFRLKLDATCCKIDTARITVVVLTLHSMRLCCWPSEIEFCGNEMAISFSRVKRSRRASNNSFESKWNEARDNLGLFKVSIVFCQIVHIQRETHETIKSTIRYFRVFFAASRLNFVAV